MRLGKALATGVAEERPRETTDDGLRLGEEIAEFKVAEVAAESGPAAEEVPVVR